MANDKAEKESVQDMNQEEFVDALKEAQSNKGGEFVSTEKSQPEGSARVYFDPPKRAEDK